MNDTNKTPKASAPAEVAHQEEVLAEKIINAYLSHPREPEPALWNLCNAAPELLEACKLMAQIGVWGKSSPVFAKACAAIAKATGAQL